MNLSKITTQQGVSVEVVEWETPHAVGEHTLSTFRLQVQQHNERMRQREATKPADVARTGGAK